MKLDFRIDWGYQYNCIHYHPFYHWDRHLDVHELNVSDAEY